MSIHGNGGAHGEAEAVDIVCLRDFDGGAKISIIIWEAARFITKNKREWRCDSGRREVRGAF